MNVSFDHTKAEEGRKNISVRVGAMVSWKSPLTYRSYQKIIHDETYFRVAKRVKPVNPTIPDALPGLYM